MSFERSLEFFLDGTFRRNPGESMGTTQGKGVRPKKEGSSKGRALVGNSNKLYMMDSVSHGKKKKV